jgi:drug/metabolite transporter (DMT)-like permease
VIRGILGVLIALFGIVLLVAGWSLGGLSDDPQTQMIGGVAGVACLIVGGYLLYRAIRPSPRVTNP